MQLGISSGDTSNTLRMLFDIDVHTLYDIKKAYREGVDPTKRDLSKMTLYRSKKALKGDSIKLRVLGFTDDDVEDGANLTIVIRLRGGAAMKLSMNILYKDRTRTMKSSLKRTSKSCCIYGRSDVDCHEMPCGHVFSAEGMFATIRNVLTKSKTNCDLVCPMCNTEFEFRIAARVAGLNMEERAYICSEFDRRSMPPTKMCPGCRTLAFRPDGLARFRVSCGGCAGGDWCFLCAGKWRNGGFTVCGNEKCSTFIVNDLLQNCDMKKASCNVDIPEIRACPKCLALVHHDIACKHMTCGCGHKFCFTCLKAYDKSNSRWPCGSYTTQCSVAPRQRF